MRITLTDLRAAKQAGILTQNQTKQLWTFLSKDQEEVPSFQFSHVMYYFGGLLAISAITLFFTQAWETLRGLPLFFVSCLFFLLGLVLTHFFLKRKLRIPAGILATFSLAVVPLAVYNIQTWLGYPPEFQYHYSDFHYWVNWYWIPMELATLVVGVVLFSIYRFSFLLFPVSIALWYMSMDLVPLIFNLQRYDFNDRATFSLFFGLFMLLIAVYVDVKYQNKKQDYAFWLYIFGVITFWGGLSCQESHNEWSRFFLLHDQCRHDHGQCLFQPPCVCCIWSARCFRLFGAFILFCF